MQNKKLVLGTLVVLVLLFVGFGYFYKNNITKLAKLIKILIYLKNHYNIIL